MKKLCLSILLFLSISSLGFAKPIVQFDGEVIGLFHGLFADPFSETDNKVSGDLFFVPLCSGRVKLSGEFASNDLKPVHFFTGVELGVFDFILFEGEVFGGFSYHLTDIFKHRLEFGLNIGETILFDSALPVTRISVDLQVMPSNRHGFFGGIGLETFVLPGSFEYYKEFGLEMDLMGITSLHASLGWRF